MVDEKEMQGDLKETVVRICPACGVVNPAGPSNSCPHHQLARFDGVTEELQELLSEVAKARATFGSKVAELTKRVKQSLRDREAEMETQGQGAANQSWRPAERKYPSSPPLSLENPTAPRKKQRKIRKRKKVKGPHTVHPKQLELIAREPAKGDA